MGETLNDKALRMFTDLMVEKIQEVSDDPDKPWFSMTSNGLPQNIEGRMYHGMNSLMLYLLCEKMNYKTPVFLTFLQAKAQGVNVKKGEKSFPVLYWNFSIKNMSGHKITMDEYNLLTKEEKREFTVVPYTSIYNVFNVDQTNYKELFPEKWEELKKRFAIRELQDENGMFSCPKLDQMIQENAWLCPIVLEPIDNAFYRPSEDKIYLPLKGQFYKGEDFYSTMLHEMGHSTGEESRCAREIKNKFGDRKYGKEELVAELVAAVTSNSLGIVTGVQKENAQYLKSWLNAIREEPKFLYTILTDVGKASTMILNEVNKLNLQVSLSSSPKEVPTESVKEQTVPVMTEEDYLSSKGYPFVGLGEAALHKGIQKTARQQNKMIELQAEKDLRYTETRENLRNEYQHKLAKGEIRKPTSIERLISTAKGMPELESTQAARRLLKKRGISIDEEKNENENTKDLTAAFRFAITAALTGAFQPLVELKQKGFSPSVKDLEILKDTAPSIRPAVESIFHIRIDSLQCMKLAEADKKNEVKQLSLNF